MSTWCKVSHTSTPSLVTFLTEMRTAEGLICLISAGPGVHKHQYSSSHAMNDINLDNVCKKGSTLLWDLVQDEDAVQTKNQFLT